MGHTSSPLPVVLLDSGYFQEGIVGLGACQISKAMREIDKYAAGRLYVRKWHAGRAGDYANTSDKESGIGGASSDHSIHLASGSGPETFWPSYFVWDRVFGLLGSFRMSLRFLTKSRENYPIVNAGKVGDDGIVLAGPQRGQSHWLYAWPIEFCFNLYCELNTCSTMQILGGHLRLPPMGFWRVRVAREPVGHPGRSGQRVAEEHRKKNFHPGLDLNEHFTFP
ncbi:hypothetical protein L218DRAFT_951480 [Marasmius fiardii PR-910]|nr:hypothetical protein L218DRAFT_951480 [Marasmius fiardii PR-910]